MKRKSLILIAVIVILMTGFTTSAVQAQTTTNVTYVVQEGDTLGTIAAEYCTTWQAIYDMNAEVIGSNPNLIYPGMVLTIPAGCVPGSTPPPSNGVYDHGPQTGATGVFYSPYYTVAWGDYLSAIGQRFGVPYTDIMTANGLTSQTIYAGQVLYIPGYTTSPPPPPSSGGAERVSFSSGSTAASRTGTISNGQPKTYVLTILQGQTLYVYGKSHAEPLTVSVTNSVGQALTVTGTNGAVSFNVAAYIPATDDYFVTFTPVYPPESPSLTFDVTFYIP